MSDTPETNQAAGTVSVAATEGAVTTTVATIPPHTAAAATGVLSRLESDFEKELAKGEAVFKNWFKSTVAELKLHLKV